MTLLPQEMNVGLPIRQLGLRREGELGTRLRRVKARTLKKNFPSATAQKAFPCTLRWLWTDCP